ncbi:LAMI_0H12794g1_1 [Lachancea mirantina]|uniref:LAMI_0H12794g1_1 n=1 Tax=Lachancea mirantina TaxID=1230905 RepID=A0A1G4KHJ3_9SACH|nr:LAMI_0H12794g1_1 [Lachancea mirantina]
MEDTVQISQAMDALAKTILARRLQQQKDGESDPQQRWRDLKGALDPILALQRDEAGNTVEMDSVPLTSSPSPRLELLERNGQKFALVPVKRVSNGYSQASRSGATATTSPSPGWPAAPAKSKKKKKNKIPCSYCHETGHTRAHCENRLLNST